MVACYACLKEGTKRERLLGRSSWLGKDCFEGKTPSSCTSSEKVQSLVSWERPCRIQVFEVYCPDQTTEGCYCKGRLAFDFDRANPIPRGTLVKQVVTGPEVEDAWAMAGNRGRTMKTWSFFEEDRGKLGSLNYNLATVISFSLRRAISTSFC